MSASDQRLRALESYTMHAHFAGKWFRSVWNSNPGGHGRGESAPPEMFTAMCFWYSALAVVMEGWEELSDPPPSYLQEMLSDRKRAMLRRFRNKTFHPQDCYPHPQMLEYIEGEESVAYAFAVDSALRHAIHGALTQAGLTPSAY